MSNKCQCYATINEEDPRYEVWMSVDPEGKLPLKHPRIIEADDGPYKGHKFYVGDPSRLTAEQRKLIVEKMSKKFKLTKEEVEHDLATHGFPIKTDNVTVTICKFHLRNQ